MIQAIQSVYTSDYNENQKRDNLQWKVAKNNTVKSTPPKSFQQVLLESMTRATVSHDDMKQGEWFINSRNI